MKSWPRNPEFRNNPENFHPCESMGLVKWWTDTKNAPNTISTHISWHDPNGFESKSAEFKH